MIRGASALALAACLLGACAPRDRAPSVSDALCISPVPPRVALPPAAPERRAALVQAGFAPEAARVADVIGALGTVEDLLAAERRRRDIAGLALTENRLERILILALLEAHATSAAIRCEGARIDQLRDQLAAREAEQNRRLSLIGIAIGAGTAAVTGGLGFLSTSTAANIAGIVGGSAGAGVSALQLNVEARGRLRLHQNMLEELWLNPAEPRLFPPRVWRHLTWPDPGGATLRERIIEDWRANHLIGRERPGQEPAILRLRGPVDSDTLETLRMMLEPLEAQIALMARDLRLLMEELAARPTPR